MASKVTFNGELCFPNDYLSAVEFKGRDVTLTISAISREMLQKKGGKDKRETVFRFNGTVKKFVCNKTNADTIASMYGTKAELWVGKKITLYPTTCMAFGEKVDCIRIREVKPAAAAQTTRLPAEPDQFASDQDSSIGGEEPNDAPAAPADDDAQTNPEDEPGNWSEKQVINWIVQSDSVPDGMELQEAQSIATKFLRTMMSKPWSRMKADERVLAVTQWKASGCPAFKQQAATA